MSIKTNINDVRYELTVSSWSCVNQKTQTLICLLLTFITRTQR